MVRVAASILAANKDYLGEEIKRACDAGCDMIHVDVMDGQFVSNVTDGKHMMKTAIKNSIVPIDVHLMINHPYKHLRPYLKAQCITFHVEAVDENEAMKIIRYLKKKNIMVGISIKPNTEIKSIDKYIELIDKVLVMTVEPGLGGQNLIPETLNKVRELRQKQPELDIQVDGGINGATSKFAIEAGANILVAGTALFKSNDMTETIKKIASM